MRSIIIAVVTALAFVATVAAGPRKVLVLPVDGNAPAAQRSSINSAVVKLAKSGIDGDVTAGDTTFADTAAAVGCSPDQATCADTVLSTLSVDEVVWGTASVENGSTTVTIHRAAKGEPARQQIAVIDATATGDQASAGLEPLFTREAAVPVGSGSEMGSGSGSAPERPHTGSFFDTKERKIGFGLAAGSVSALVIGFSLWAGQSSLQDQIDNHPTMTLAQLQDLHNLEDRASTKAIWGNVFVALGIGLGGASTYYFWKDHKNRTTAPVVAPAPTEDGTGVKLTIGGRW